MRPTQLSALALSALVVAALGALPGVASAATNPSAWEVRSADARASSQATPALYRCIRDWPIGRRMERPFRRDVWSGCVPAPPPAMTLENVTK